MKVMITRHIDYRRPGSTLCFTLSPRGMAVCLPHDVRDFVIANGAGHIVPTMPGDRSGGLAAFIERKQGRA